MYVRFGKRICDLIIGIVVCESRILHIWSARIVEYACGVACHPTSSGLCGYALTGYAGM